MKKLNQLSACILFTLGVIHIIFGLLEFHSINLRLMWFLGSGLAMLFLAFLNLITIEINLSRPYQLTQISNFLFTLFVLSILIIEFMPQGLVALVSTLLVMITLFITKRTEEHQSIV